MPEKVLGLINKRFLLMDGGAILDAISLHKANPSGLCLLSDIAAADQAAEANDVEAIAALANPSSINTILKAPAAKITSMTRPRTWNQGESRLKKFGFQDLCETQGDRLPCGVLNEDTWVI